MGSLGLTELLVILTIVILLFGTKKLKTLGSDLGGAIKGFRKAVTQNDGEQIASQDTQSPTVDQVDKNSAQDKS